MRCSVALMVVACLVGTCLASETYDAGTKTLTVTADSLAATVDPLGQQQDFNAATYSVPAMTKDDFNALPGLKTITFNSGPDARQGTTSIIAYYDATNTVTFNHFGNSVGYNYSGGWSAGRNAHSGTQPYNDLGTVGGDALGGPFHGDAATPGLEGLNWFKTSIAVSEAGRGVIALGFIIDGRDDQPTQDGNIWVTLSDATEVQLPYTPFGGVAGSGLFFGYQAPAGLFITAIEGTRLDKSGNSFLALDDLTFVLSSPALVGDVNNDGCVDVVDLLYLVDAFGAVTGDANYNPACDFNSDGSVDVIDLLTMVDNFGTCL